MPPSLSEVVDLSERTLTKWYEAYQLRKAVPAPMPTEEALSCMVPGFFLLGTQTTYDFYKQLYDQISFLLVGWFHDLPVDALRQHWFSGVDTIAALARIDWKARAFEFLLPPSDRTLRDWVLEGNRHGR